MSMVTKVSCIVILVYFLLFVFLFLWDRTIADVWFVESYRSFWPFKDINIFLFLFLFLVDLLVLVQSCLPMLHGEGWMPKGCIY